MSISVLPAWMLAASLLTGCEIARVVSGGVGAVTPESAAINAVVEQKQGGNFILDQTSIQVLQTQRLAENYAVVQIAYQGFRQAQRQECLSLHATIISQRGGWITTGGGSGCGPVEQNNVNRFEVGLSSNSGGGVPGDPGYTAVDGFVKNPRIKSVSVTWQDGQVQQVNVINGAFLAARLGNQAYQTVQGLDENGKVIDTRENTPPAPGKISP